MIAALFVLVIVLASGWITHALLYVDVRKQRDDSDDEAREAWARVDELAARPVKR